MGLRKGKQENQRQSTRVEKREFYRILEAARLAALKERIGQ